MHPEYKILDQRPLPDIHAEGTLYEHIKTGAQVMSITTDDDNKVFGVTFRTPPSDSTGVPHIIEHAVLGGSHKYPVKEPFKELLKGSLQTFLNAMTYPDKTIYPVASRNLRDYYNLMDVYLDAVFFPSIPEETFQQEGWHIEWENDDTDPIYKGIVFNEMKGIYGSPDNVVMEYAQQTLFPNTPYCHDSGGNPKAILDLSYEQFKAFHETYYHPSNARIYFYGNDNPEERLNKLDEVLQQFKKGNTAPALPEQSPFSEMQTIHESYEADPSEENHFVLKSWILGDSSDLNSNLKFSILGYLLIGSPAAPLRIALLESGLGDDLTGAGMDGNLRQTYLSTGLRGVTKEQVDKVIPLIDETLFRIGQDGFKKELIEAALNSIEFGLRENNSGSYPRGLVFMLKTMSTWLHDKDPFAPLNFSSILENLKTEYQQNPNLFTDLVNDLLVNNPHKTQLIIAPDSEKSTQEAEVEAKRLAKEVAALSDAEKTAVQETTKKLKALQNTPDSEDALATIPALNLSDLDEQIEIIPREQGQLGASQLITHSQPTNGIVYLDFAFDLSDLPHNLCLLLPLFGRALTELGTKKESYIEITERIGRETGGISSSSYVGRHYVSHREVLALIVRAKALGEKRDAMLGIVQDLLLDLNLDNPERFLQMVLEEKSGEESRVTPAGNSLVRNRLHARTHAADHLQEAIDGISYLSFLRDLAKRVETDWDAVRGELEQILTTTVTQSRLLINLTCDANKMDALTQKVNTVVQQFPVGDKPQAIDRSGLVLPKTELLTYPTKVNYVGQAFDLTPTGYEMHGSLMVILRLVRTYWLWDEVRAKGGAYGSGCSFDRHSKVLSFNSYHDPNTQSSLDVYGKTGQFLSNHALSDSEITRLVIGTSGDMDPCLLPDAKGYRSMIRHMMGISDDMRQQLRSEAISTELKHFRELGNILEGVSETPLAQVILCSEDTGKAFTEQWSGSSPVFTAI